jgi:oxysterol-binding protein-related protein 9/10/11
VLGEHFRAHWDVIPVSYPADPSDPPIQHLYVALPAPRSKSDIVSIKSAQSSHVNVEDNNLKNADTLSVNSANSGINNKVGNSSPTSAAQVAVGETILAAGMSNLSLAGSTYVADTGELIEGEVEGGERVRVIYLVSISYGIVSDDDPYRSDGED